MKPHQEQNHRRPRRNASISVEPLEGRALLSLGAISVPTNATPQWTWSPVTTPPISTPTPTTNVPTTPTNTSTTPANTPTISTGTNSFVLRANLSFILRPTRSTPTVVSKFPRLVSGLTTPTSNVASTYQTPTPPTPPPAVLPSGPTASGGHHSHHGQHPHAASAGAGHDGLHQHQPSDVVASGAHVTRG